ncbi:MobF family relaxase [Aquimarina algiphila]|uniref:AAA family ATPase n=1 Tax=Aquimarina algiphila TaxID=2047982 RepID=A0A554VCE6_9FLAO|nr:MobF family relaxase [Aquimarina algiphila]TSE04356.1 AAA family ATPase [Aquimarina algiphila]
MLRITPSKNAGAAIKYFRESLTKGDYFFGDNPPGLWGGKAAERIGLSGEVTFDQFKALAYNQNPVTGEKLNPRFSERRRVGYDFTFNATKSVSLAMEFSKDASVKADIKDVWLTAVNDTMKEIERDMQTRDHWAKATRDVNTGNMIWASFTHDKSRPVNGIPSPHLHQHVYVFNTTWFDKKDRFQAGQFGQLKKDAPYYESIFHNHMAKGLTDKGFTINIENGRAELAALSRDLIDRFSERTKQIETHAKKKGITDAKTKSEIGAKIRESKEKQKPPEVVAANWDGRITTSDRKDLDDLRNDDSDPPPMSAIEALTFAIEHELETKSTINEKRLLRTAINHGLGRVTVKELMEAYRPLGVMTGRDKYGEMKATTKDILREEEYMIRYAKEGKNKHTRLTDLQPEIPDYFNKGQRAAVLTILGSKNAVEILDGKAGVGKSTVFQNIAKNVERENINVIGIAPTHSATDNLKKDGIKHTATVSKFAHSDALQKQFANQVVLMDESAMVGTQLMAKVFRGAEKYNYRVILAGDTKQHASVARGDAQRILTDIAKIKPIILDEIRRQKPLAYRKAVGWLSKGQVDLGFKQLDKIGAIKEIDDDERYKMLAKNYVTSLESGQTALVVSPTHKEKDLVTAEVRQALRDKGLIGNEDVETTIHKAVRRSEAERKDTRYYDIGQGIQLTQNVRGHTKGERLKIIGKDDDHLLVTDRDGNKNKLAVKDGSRFHLYEEKKEGFAINDTIRITKGGASIVNGIETIFKTNDREPIKALTDDGDFILASGKILSKEFGNIDHGIVTTSHSSQGQTVDNVFIAVSEHSFGQATNLQQFYVSASRGRNKVEVYTNDKEELLEQARKTSERLAASELIEKRNGFWNQSISQATEYIKQVKAYMEDYKRRQSPPDKELGLSR